MAFRGATPAHEIISPAPNTPYAPGMIYSIMIGSPSSTVDMVCHRRRMSGWLHPYPSSNRQPGSTRYKSCTRMPVAPEPVKTQYPVPCILFSLFFTSIQSVRSNLQGSRAFNPTIDRPRNYSLQASKIPQMKVYYNSISLAMMMYFCHQRKLLLEPGCPR